MHSPEAIQTAHVAALEGAVRCLLAAAVESGLDGLRVSGRIDSDGDVLIDLEHLANGVVVSGESL